MMKTRSIILGVCLLFFTKFAFSSSYTPRGMYPEDIAAEMNGVRENVIRINLKNKPLCFASDDKIFDSEKATEILGVLPDTVQILDLSLNRLPEDALPSFINLLRRTRFEWLDITTNSGADSLQGLRNLTTAMGEKGISVEDQRELLKKIIWVNKSHLDYSIERGILPTIYGDTHRQYYAQKESLDSNSDLWASLGV